MLLIHLKPRSSEVNLMHCYNAPKIYFREVVIYSKRKLRDLTSYSTVKQNSHSIRTTALTKEKQCLILKSLSPPKKSTA